MGWLFAEACWRRGCLVGWRPLGPLGPLAVPAGRASMPAEGPAAAWEQRRPPRVLLAGKQATRGAFLRGRRWPALPAARQTQKEPAVVRWGRLGALPAGRTAILGRHTVLLRWQGPLQPAGAEWERRQLLAGRPAEWWQRWSWQA